jgi:hypothetical protein
VGSLIHLHSGLRPTHGRRFRLSRVLVTCCCPQNSAPCTLQCAAVPGFTSQTPHWPSTFILRRRGTVVAARPPRRSETRTRGERPAVSRRQAATGPGASPRTGHGRVCPRETRTEARADRGGVTRGGAVGDPGATRQGRSLTPEATDSKNYPSRAETLQEGRASSNAATGPDEQGPTALKHTRGRIECPT